MRIHFPLIQLVFSVDGLSGCASVEGSWWWWWVVWWDGGGFLVAWWDGYNICAAMLGREKLLGFRSFGRSCGRFAGRKYIQWMLSVKYCFEEERCNWIVNFGCGIATLLARVVSKLMSNFYFNCVWFRWVKCRKPIVCVSLIKKEITMKCNEFFLALFWICITFCLVSVLYHTPLLDLVRLLLEQAGANYWFSLETKDTTYTYLLIYLLTYGATNKLRSWPASGVSEIVHGLMPSSANPLSRS